MADRVVPRVIIRRPAAPGRTTQSTASRVPLSSAVHGYRKYMYSEYKYNVQLLYAKTVFREAVKVRKKLKGRSAAVKVRFSYVRYNSIGPLRGP